MAADCKTLMYKTLKTGIITECSVFLRLPDSPEILMRQLRFQPYMGELAVCSYPEGTKTPELLIPIVNIFELDQYCNITDIVSTKSKELKELVGLPITVLFPDDIEAVCTEKIILDTISTGQTHTFYAQFQLPGSHPTHAFIKTTTIKPPKVILTTRHIP